MTVLNYKHPTLLLEVTRPLIEADKMFYTVLNRPLEDIEQRTKDLNNIFAPARGLRVRQTYPATGDVVVEVGAYCPTDTGPLTFPQAGISQTLTVTPTAAGNIRMDLVYFRMDTGQVYIEMGNETLAATTYPTLFSNVAPPKRSWLPAGLDDAVPLAYLYVGPAGTVYNEDIAINTAGHIRDCRVSPGAEQEIFENVAATFLPDNSAAATGLLGATTTVARADHKHDVNVSAAVPAALGAYPAQAGAAGASFVYSRKDHRHEVSTEATVTDIHQDNVSYAGDPAGSDFPRADHQHPMKLTGSVPVALSPASVAAAGSSLFYMKNDHRHAISATGMDIRTYLLTWNFAFGTRTTGALPFDPLVAIAMVASERTAGQTWCAYGQGWIWRDGNGVLQQGGYSACEKQDVDQSRGCGQTSSFSGYLFGWSAGGGGVVPPIGNGYKTSFLDYWLQVTAFSSAGITIDQLAAASLANYTRVHLIVFGQP